MRTVFWTYVLVIVGGIVCFLVVGATG